jgi:predicted transposase YbfD/YdcC
MQNASPGSLSAHFQKLRDPRIDRTKAHSLHDILIIAILAMLCGADSFTDMEDFGHAKDDWLGGFLDLPNGIPSHDTFTRVFAALDPQQFMDCFIRWSQNLRQAVSEEIVAMDGKSLRRSMNQGRGPIHLVNAWAAQNRLVLGQQKVDAKSNEITAIPELLRALELSGCIVTIDAMGCQKNIAKEIHEADADYVLALKGNQTVLHQEVKEFLDDALSRHFAQLPHQYHQTVEKDHGRLETRRYWVTDQIGWMADRDQWENLHSIGLVEATRQIGEQTTTERRYYLSSLPADAPRFARAVRTHWGIENSLHWTLDVALQEDQCRVRTGYAAQNLAALRAMTLNLLKRDTQKKRGIRGKQKIAGWDHSYLLSLLTF